MRNGIGVPDPSGSGSPWMMVFNTSNSVAPENGRRPASKFVQENAEGKDVAAGVQRAARGLLR